MAKQSKRAKHLKKAREVKKGINLKNKVPEITQIIVDLDDFLNNSSDVFSELSEDEFEHFTEVNYSFNHEGS